MIREQQTKKNKEVNQKIGIIGLGHIAGVHLSALADNSFFAVNALCDKNSEALKKYNQENIHTYEDVEQMLENEELDAVIVATSNGTHFELGKLCLEAGLDVMIEKPVAQSMEEIKDLQSLAEEKKCVLYSAFHAAQAREVIWLKNYLKDENVQLKSGMPTGFGSYFYDPYIRDGVLEAGAIGLQNCWIDSGVNALSVLEHFFDLDAVISTEIAEAKSSTDLACKYSTIQGALRAETFEGWIDTSWTTGRNYKETKLLFGQTGEAAILNHSDQTVSWVNPDGAENLLIDFGDTGVRLVNHYQNVFQDFQHHLEKRITNIDLSQRIHTLLFQINSQLQS